MDSEKSIDLKQIVKSSSDVKSKIRSVEWHQFDTSFLLEYVNKDFIKVAQPFFYTGDIDQLLLEGKQMLDEQFAPDGYNIGINCGAAAGQTIFHVHVHLIPRFNGDIEEPRGGVRGGNGSIDIY